MTRRVSAEERFNSNVFSFIDWIEERCEETHLKALQRIRTILEYLDDEMLVENWLKNAELLIPSITTKEVAVIREVITSALPAHVKTKYKDAIDKVFTIEESDLEEFWDILESLLRCSISYAHDNEIEIGSYNVVSLAQNWNVKLGEEVLDEISDSSSES